MQKDNLPIIEFKDICFGYTRDRINLDHISFKIYPNEYVCVVGHNGSGKSTISKVISNLVVPWSGSYLISGQEIDRSNQHFVRSKVNIVFQNPDNQFIGLTVKEDMAFTLENNFINQKYMDPIISIVATNLHIESLLNLPPNNLSASQKQKVAIASTLCSNSDVIIFDESTALLTPNDKKELKNTLLTLRDKYNKTIISVTHDMEEIINADKIIIINHGQVYKIVTPNEFFKMRDELLTISLDVPFILQFISELEKQKPANISLPPFPNTVDIDEIIDHLKGIKYEKK